MKKLPLKYHELLTVTLSFLLYTLNCTSQEPEITQNHKLVNQSEPLIIHGMRQDFVRIPEGDFLMGSDERSDEQPVHSVNVCAFDMATTEVTVRQFRIFIQATLYKTDAEISGSSFACCWRPKLGISWRNPGFQQDDDEPVVAISWNDAEAYCQWLSEETGDEYRLPAEAEWEYACKPSNYSDPHYSLDSMAWYNKNSEYRTHKVATKNCNDKGLFDMFGNAWEWTQDLYHENYNGAPADGTPWISGGSEAQRGYLKAGEGRVLRGGSWGLATSMHPVSYDLRLTSRPVFGRKESCNNSGFRLVRSVSVHTTPENNYSRNSDSFTVRGIVFDMILLPPGSFMMGKITGDRTMEPVHQVNFRKPFRISISEITVRQFRSFVNVTGYITDAEHSGKCWDSDFRSHHATILQSGINWRNPGFNQTEDDPVTCVTWNDAMEFCKWLSGESGRCCRLPSEAEWEYACNSGTTEADKNSYPEISWYYDNSAMMTHPVAQKKANAWGIYDMLGNVSEWIADVWHPNYKSAPDDGSSWLGDPLTARVCRGGSFERESSEMGLHGRDWYNESEAVVGVGFRIVEAGIP